MELKDLAGFRPAEPSAAAITASLERIDAAVVDLEARAAQLAEKRASALLSAGTKEILGIEADQAAVRVDIDRLQALRASIAGGLESARRGELATDLMTKRQADADAGARRDAWMRENFPTIMALLRAGAELENAADATAVTYRRALDAALPSAGRWAERISAGLGDVADPEAFRPAVRDILLVGAGGTTMTLRRLLDAMPDCRTREQHDALTASVRIVPARDMTPEELAKTVRRGVEVRGPAVRMPGSAAPDAPDAPAVLHPHGNAAA